MSSREPEKAMCLLGYADPGTRLCQTKFLRQSGKNPLIEISNFLLMCKVSVPVPVWGNRWMEWEEMGHHGE